MFTRASPSQSVKAWLKNHIIPEWDEKPITDLQARPVDLWLKSLRLSPQSKVHIRGVIRELWEYAMYRDDVELQRNRMERVRIKVCDETAKESSKPDGRGVSIVSRATGWGFPDHGCGLHIIRPSDQRMPRLEMVRCGLAQCDAVCRARHCPASGRRR
jgi:hypothetical protein